MKIKLTLLALFVSPAVIAGSFEWTVSRDTGGKTSLVLTDKAKTISLRTGWTCMVGPTSADGGQESRTATCSKGDEEFRFVVRCDAQNPADHVQIQFGTKLIPDYFEVLCAPKKAV